VTLAPEEHHELVLAPAGVTLPDRLDRLQLGQRPGRSTPADGSVAVVLEALETMGLEPVSMAM
jgi:hypothetical protein